MTTQYFTRKLQEIDPVETGQRLISLHRQLGEKHRVVEELASLGNIITTEGFMRKLLHAIVSP